MKLFLTNFNILDLADNIEVIGCWVPVAELVKAIVCNQKLTPGTSAGSVYVSHKWLSLACPDLSGSKPEVRGEGQKLPSDRFFAV